MTLRQPTSCLLPSVARRSAVGNHAARRSAVGNYAARRSAVGRPSVARRSAVGVLLPRRSAGGSLPRKIAHPLLMFTLLLLADGWPLTTAQAAESESKNTIAQSLESIRSIGLEGQGSAAAIAAASALSKLDSQSLPAVLSGMDGASPLAKNWLLGVAGTLAQRGPLPVDQLEEYLRDTQHDADARYWVFQLLTAGEPEVQAQRLDQLLNDPGAELKHLAVTHYLNKLEQLKEADDKPAQLALLNQLLAAARDPAQIQTIAGHLKTLDQPVDLRIHFGFISSWQAIGPFDNVGGKGFDTVYAPELAILENGQAEMKLSEACEGKTGPVAWREVMTDKEDGAVDLNPVFEKEKGAAVYAWATFEAAHEQTCQVRLGCINANKVWLNGQQLLSNEVYHAGSAIDQYIGQGQLQAGTNRLLLKICQNEQTESWAQDWSFQLRITDLTGQSLAQ